MHSSSVNADRSTDPGLYSGRYYHRLRDGARKSAQAVVPIVLQLVQPRSVIDVGCGLGTWLRVFQEAGVSDVQGVDGPHVDPAMLEIPPACFTARDLRFSLGMARTFDLVLSLEVAEHLPETCAELLVEELTALGPVVLFSAAIPGQGGEGHVNEQWPEYWAKRFDARDFAPIDALRTNLWQNPEVDWWYAQNMLVYVRRGCLKQYPDLARACAGDNDHRLSMVHPQLRLQLAWRNRVARTTLKLSDLVPACGRFILVDQDQFGELPLGGNRQVVPFPEQDGKYAGPPPDAEQAVAEIERLRGAGAGWIVFGWPAFWWLDHYSDLRDHLDTRYRRVMEDEDLVVFDLR